MGLPYNSEKCENEEKLDCSWRSPHNGWKFVSPKVEGKRYRLNVVGIQVSGWSAAGGGVIRNEKGKWVAGFAQNLGSGKVLEAKLCALYRGLELAWKSGWEPLEVDSDSKVAVPLVLNQLVHEKHPLFRLVRNCQELLEKSWRCSLRCVSAEQTYMANFLATLGLDLMLGCHYFDVPPPACATFLVQDECSAAPLASVAASKMKPRKADRVNQGNARVKKLRVQKLIQKARRMRKQKVEDDHESVTITWRINSISNLYTFKHYSEPFIIGDFKGRILMYSKGNKEDYLSVYLNIQSTRAFTLGWSRYAKISLTLVNQLRHSKSITNEIIHVLKDCERDCGFKSLIPLSQFYDHVNGYIVNDICIIEAKIAVRKADAKILQDHGISAHIEPLCKEKEGQGPSNVQHVNVKDISAQWETPCCEQVPASYRSAPISEQIVTELPNISVAKEIKMCHPHQLMS